LAGQAVNTQLHSLSCNQKPKFLAWFDLKDANMVCYVANVLNALSPVLQFATEAAITILRIDDMIRIEKAEDDGMEG